MMYALAQIAHIGIAANSARSGREILGLSGGDSTSSSHSPHPAPTNDRPSTTVNTGSLTSAFTTPGTLHPSPTARKPTRITEQRAVDVRSRLIRATRAPTRPPQGAPITMRAGATVASTANCTACTNTYRRASVPIGGTSAPTASTAPPRASHLRCHSTRTFIHPPIVVRTVLRLFLQAVKIGSNALLAGVDMEPLSGVAQPADSAPHVVQRAPTGLLPGWPRCPDGKIDAWTYPSCRPSLPCSPSRSRRSRPGR